MAADTDQDILRNALFHPRAIALIGASADAAKLNARPQRLLQRFGYAGRVVPINPTRAEILGERAWPDLDSAPGPIDHAFVMVPAGAVPDAIAQCARAGVRVATLFSAGFAELGAEGLARQCALVDTARAAGLRLLGPNCMGIVNVTDGVPITMNAVIEQEPLVPGGLSVVSQSGSMIGAILSRAQPRGLGFAKLVSVGNECDLGVGELADILVDDAATSAILLFLETFRDAPNLARAAARAHAAGKPIIVFKLGRSSVGQRIATTHTGAMVGSDDVAYAFFRAHGILRVETFEALFETPQLVCGHQPPRGRRVAVVTGTGGAAAMVVDRLGMLGAEVVGPSPAVIEALLAQDIEISDAPLTDIPMGRSEGGRYSAILSALLASDHCDAVVSVLGSSSASRPQVIVERVFAARHRELKPLAVFLAPKADDGLRLLQENGVAAFRTPESCADAVVAYLGWRGPVAAPAAADPARVAAAAALARSAAHARLDERASCALFAALGVAVTEHAVWPVDGTPGTLPESADGYAVKILSADIPHKTDAGLVRLRVGATEVPGAVAALLLAARERFPQARRSGVLVQAMQRGLVEVLVGYRRDPEVGPVVMLALGGVAAELRRERAVRIAPVTLETAREMVAEIPDLAILRGFRGLPRGDIEALAQAVASVSRLADLALPVVLEAEMNPLIVKEENHGVIAVDGLVVLAGI